MSDPRNNVAQCEASVVQTLPGLVTVLMQTLLNSVDTRRATVVGLGAIELRSYQDANF